MLKDAKKLQGSQVIILHRFVLSTVTSTLHHNHLIHSQYVNID